MNVKVMFLLIGVHQRKYCYFEEFCFSKMCIFDIIPISSLLAPPRKRYIFVGPKFLKISEANQIYFSIDESCLSVKAIYSLRIWKYLLLETQILTLHLLSNI